MRDRLLCAHVKLLSNGSLLSYPHFLSQSRECTLKRAPHITRFEVCLQQWYIVETFHIDPVGFSDLFSHVEGGSCSASECQGRPMALLFAPPHMEFI